MDFLASKETLALLNGLGNYCCLPNTGNAYYNYPYLVREQRQASGSVIVLPNPTYSCPEHLQDEAS